MGKAQYGMFIDWYYPKGGNSKVNKEGNSAILTLNYAYTLLKAAEMMEWLGYQDKADGYHNQSRKYAEIVRKLCYNAEKGLYTDDPEQTFYDQRASILAVLCGAHTKAEQKRLMQNLLSEEVNFDSRANLFYYFYLFEAMEKTGVGNFTDLLKPWADIIAMGMTGTPEKRVEQQPRSEIHPWTAHPVHYYFSVVAGIRPTSPGFSTVEITPNLGGLREVKATYPTIKGDIKVNLALEGNKLIGSIILPEGMSGTYRYGEQQISLESGVNALPEVG